jgi:hypothetical protein
MAVGYVAAVFDNRRFDGAIARLRGNAV